MSTTEHRPSAVQIKATAAATIGLDSLRIARPADPKQITLSSDDLRRLEVLWASRWRRAPTREEREGLIQADVREEILYREALAAGLDQGDLVIKRHLAQKLSLMVADLVAMRKRDPAEIKAWFARNRDRFALPPRISFRHIYFAFDLRDDRTEHDADALLASLADTPDPDVADGTLGDPFMFQAFYGHRTPEEIARVFGSAFAATLFEMSPGSWQGPVASGFGWHLVWIDTLVPSREPAFEEVADAATIEWLATQRNEARDRFYETVRSQYQVEIPDAVSPFAPVAPMSAAPFVYRADGRPDWGSMWTSFCDLAIHGGRPHRGEEDALAAPDEPQPLAPDMEAVAEIIRGIHETTGLEAEPAEPGWLAIRCQSRKMAAWLCATIIMENVEARCEGDRLFLPASPDFTLKNQIKSVITVVAKTNHYWQAHVNGTYVPQLEAIQWRAQYT